MPNLDLRPVLDEYFDFVLSKDQTSLDYIETDSTKYLGMFVKTNESLSSKVILDSRILSEGELNNVTLTGFDNFLIDDPTKYNDGDIDTSYKLAITSGDTFTFHRVSGHTTNLSYEIVPDIDGSLKLNGGFLQGYYKIHDYPLEFFPKRVTLGWTVDMIIKAPQEPKIISGTLNNLYPDNYGFIFYMGTRAENKYSNVPTDPLTSEEVARMQDLGFVLSDGNMSTSGASFTLYSSTANSETSYDPNVDPGYKIVYNNIESVSGTSINLVSYTNGSELKWLNSKTNEWVDYKGFYHFIDGIPYSGKLHFIEYNQSEKCPVCGSVLVIDGNYAECPQCTYADVANATQLFEYFPEKGVIDNAFGIRIKADGTIGYKKITIMDKSCLYERNLKKYFNQFSPEDIVIEGAVDNEDGYYSCRPLFDYNSDRKINITITFRRDFALTDCELENSTYANGVLKIYSNGVLIFKKDDFKEVLTRELFELPELQQTVPFNISWGGGSQGLLESVTFGGKDVSQLGKLIEQNFAGTFEGNLYEFKMYARPLDFTEIRQNFENRISEYNMQYPT